MTTDNLPDDADRRVFDDADEFLAADPKVAEALRVLGVSREAYEAALRAAEPVITSTTDHTTVAAAGG